MDLNVAYAVTTWSGSRLLETLKSIPDSHRVLVIDNSQTGWVLAKAWNYAIQRLCVEEGYDAVCICNDDILVDVPQPGTVWSAGHVMADALLNGSPGFLDPRPEPVIVSGYNLRIAPHTGPEAMRDPYQEGIRWRPHPDFSFFCTNERIFDKVGPCYEGYNPCYFEDNDWHWRIKCAGYGAYSLAPYFHYGSATVANDIEREQVVRQTFELNRAKYIARWGGGPGEEKFKSPSVHLKQESNLG